MIQDDDFLPRVTEPPFLSALHAKNDTTSPFGHKLGESTENNKAPLFFPGKETVKTFSFSLAASAARQIFGHYSPRFQRIIVKYYIILVNILAQAMNRFVY